MAYSALQSPGGWTGTFRISVVAKRWGKERTVILPKEAWGQVWGPCVMRGWTKGSGWWCFHFCTLDSANLNGGSFEITMKSNSEIYQSNNLSSNLGNPFTCAGNHASWLWLLMGVVNHMVPPSFFYLSLTFSISPSFLYIYYLNRYIIIVMLYIIYKL